MICNPSEVERYKENILISLSKTYDVINYIACKFLPRIALIIPQPS